MVTIKSKELGICERVSKKLRSGDPITDAELSIARRYYRETVEFIQALKDSRYDFFLVGLRDDLQLMDDYYEARKKFKVMLSSTAK